jgi:uncharacterized membrane protein
MVHFITAYFTTAIVFLAIDYVWLTQVATRFYFDRIGHLLMERPNMGAAAAFYLIYVVGIVLFAVGPALKNESFSYAVMYGAMFGFFTYATYDVTNYATLRGLAGYCCRCRHCVGHSAWCGLGWRRLSD